MDFGTSLGNSRQAAPCLLGPRAPLPRTLRASPPSLLFEKLSKPEEVKNNNKKRSYRLELWVRSENVH